MQSTQVSQPILYLTTRAVVEANKNYDIGLVIVEDDTPSVPIARIANKESFSNGLQVFVAGYGAYEDPDVDGGSLYFLRAKMRGKLSAMIGRAYSYSLPNKPNIIEVREDRRKEGIHVGFSSAANVCAAIKLFNSGLLGKSNATIVTVLCDTGLKYSH